MFLEYEIRQLNEYNNLDNIEIIKNTDNTIFLIFDTSQNQQNKNINDSLLNNALSSLILTKTEFDNILKTIIDKKLNLQYSNFALLQIFNNNEVNLIEFETPETFFVHQEIVTPIDFTIKTIDSRNLKISKFKMDQNDFLILVTNGIVLAGIGNFLKEGWSWNKIANYIQRNINKETTPNIIADKLIFVTNELSKENKILNNIILAVKTGKKQNLVVAAGPPVNKETDDEFIKEFLNNEGKKIICGGSTANLIAKKLKKTVNVILSVDNSEIPPKGELEGIDLVTEGAITLSKTLEIIDNFQFSKIKNKNTNLQNIHNKNEFKNPAEELAFELQNADKVTILAGNAINLAHENSKIPNFKIKLIEEIAEKLERKGKEIEIKYY